MFFSRNHEFSDLVRKLFVYSREVHRKTWTSDVGQKGSLGIRKTGEVRKEGREEKQNMGAIGF